jgi:hypothetical protein
VSHGSWLALVIFDMEFCIHARVVWTEILLFVLPAQLDGRYIPPCSACWLRWGLTNYFPPLAWNCEAPKF